jgi:hypothetical protein
MLEMLGLGAETALNNEIDYPKQLEIFSTILPKYLHQVFNIVRDEQKTACHKRYEELYQKFSLLVVTSDLTG